MLKKIFAALAALLFAAAVHAAVDVNRASQAELEAVKGIGPSLSTVIVSERKHAEFKDWNDLVGRVKGVGEKNAAKFSDAGLTVHGKPYVAPAGGAAKPAKASAAKNGTAGPSTARKEPQAAKKASTSTTASGAQR